MFNWISVISILSANISVGNTMSLRIHYGLSARITISGKDDIKIYIGIL